MTYRRYPECEIGQSRDNGFGQETGRSVGDCVEELALHWNPGQDLHVVAGE